MLNDYLTLQPVMKRIGEVMSEQRSILMEDNGSRVVEANSSNDDVLFTLRFHSIKLCLPEAGVCGDN